MYEEEGAEILGTRLRNMVADSAIPLVGAVLLMSSSELDVRLPLLQCKISQVGITYW